MARAISRIRAARYDGFRVRAQTPQEVLEAVRRLEDDLQGIRARARERERDMDSLRIALREDAARERQALV
jgi:hypothetical protein